MKLTTKKKYPPYYIPTLCSILFIYLWTIGSYFNDAPQSWFHNKLLAMVVSIALFVGGMEVLYLLFDRFYPKAQAKRAKQGKTKAPLIVKIVAFMLDLITAFVVFSTLTLFLLGQRSGGGLSLSGWKAAIPAALVFLYFFVMDKYLGGTLAKRLFDIK